MDVVYLLIYHLETIAFYVSLVAAVLGGIALLLVWVGWNWLGPRYQESWAKYAVAFFRLIAASTAIAARSTPAQAGKPFWEQPWATTVLVGIIGYLCWEIAGIKGDSKAKVLKEQSLLEFNKRFNEVTQDQSDAVHTSLRLNWMLTQPRTLVSEKTQRIRRVTQANSTGRASI